MATVDTLLSTVRAAPKGPKTCAIFDFDGTIIAGYSATVFLREQIRRGDLSPGELSELVTALASFGLGNLDYSAMMAATCQFLKGIPEADYIALGEQLFTDHIARLIYPESRRLVRAHLERGHSVAIISSATPYQVSAAARDLDIDRVLCTHLELKRGKFTGKIRRPACFGEGKAQAAEGLAAELGADLDEAFFYSDSTDDLPLLERVGHPRALNPSRRLREHARQRGWPAVTFRSRGRASVGRYLRSIAATASLVPTFAAGLPIYALTGSRRAATNFSVSLFAETASALINLELDVEGEEHLWSSRPCVFVFNHQSKADVVIGAKLLRRDIAGIGKKEIKRMPIIGQVMEAGGVVMIDRANARNAIEAMKPLVQAMREEGRSVALAPEGTRTVSPKLGPFKKGAFHIAMQAGVPMVPVVIHNAGDVAPKGDFVFRPARVRVTVLPPVDTSTWSPATIDEHVREVRNQFLRTLGQPEEPAPGGRRARPGSTARKKASRSATTTGGGRRATVRRSAAAPAGAKAGPTPKGRKQRAAANGAAAPAKRKAAARKTTRKGPANAAAPPRARPKLRDGVPAGSGE